MNKNGLYTQDKINIARKKYNDETVAKTWRYQNKYGFETGTREGHEFWNNEADAFKHAYMGADLALKLGQIPSLIIGILHENETPNNPQNEWNMDSWNNNQGREIAKEIQKEYGGRFKDLQSRQQEDIIAAKIIQKMKSGDLITNPNDTRKYNGVVEKLFNKTSNLTGQAAGIEHIFTPEEIGKMTPEEFNKYENQIMAQAKAGKIVETPNDAKMYLISSPNTVLYTREDIGNMSTKEYEKHEDAIRQQMKTIGIPYNREVPKGTKTYGREKSSRSNSSASSSEDGKWVTINGNHVFIED